MAGKPEFQRRLEAIEDLIGRIEKSADPALQAAARELIELVMDLHGEGLARVLDLLRAGAEPGAHWIESMGRDDLLSSLLVLHGLHPESLETRIHRALEKIRPSLRKRGGEVELLAIEGGAVRLRMQANGHAAALREVVEGAVYQAAPDITSLILEGLEDRSGFVPVEALRGATDPHAFNGHAQNGALKGGL